MRSSRGRTTATSSRIAPRSRAAAASSCVSRTAASPRRSSRPSRRTRPDERAEPSATSGEEPRDQRTVIVHVDEERIVPLQRAQLDELDLTPPPRESLGELALLIDREQEVGLHPDDHRAPRLNALQALHHGAAVIGDVEEIARARKVQVAVRVELPGELVRVVLEVRLDLEHGAERIAIHRPDRGRDALAAEADAP